MYARGAVDNKGQCFYSLTAIKAFLELSKEFDFNLKVFIEGEEESEGVARQLFSSKKRLSLELIISSSSISTSPAFRHLRSL